MNLLVNAAHAMSDVRGTITIRTGAEKESVWLDFCDNGSGIPAAVQALVFDPFSNTKPIGKGTGLGLSLAYGIIQKHNRTIILDSAPGHGTSFRIVLPIPHSPSESP
jgi:two-component system NtrC family sensor kinase